MRWQITESKRRQVLNTTRGRAQQLCTRCHATPARRFQDCVSVDTPVRATLNAPVHPVHYSRAVRYFFSLHARVEPRGLRRRATSATASSPYCGRHQSHYRTTTTHRPTVSQEHFWSPRDSCGSNTNLHSWFVAALASGPPVMSASDGSTRQDSAPKAS